MPKIPHPRPICHHFYAFVIYCSVIQPDKVVANAVRIGREDVRTLLIATVCLGVGPCVIGFLVTVLGEELRQAHPAFYVFIAAVIAISIPLMPFELIGLLYIAPTIFLGKALLMLGGFRLGEWGYEHKLACILGVAAGMVAGFILHRLDLEVLVASSIILLGAMVTIVALWEYVPGISLILLFGVFFLVIFSSVFQASMLHTIPPDGLVMRISSRYLIPLIFPLAFCVGFYRRARE